MVHLLAQVMRLEQRSRARQNDDIWMKKQFLRGENDAFGKRRETDLCLSTLSSIIMGVR
jgi:hypothetical protein